MFHFFDDAWRFERDASSMPAWFRWIWLNRIIGWVLDMRKTIVPPGVVRLLGAILVVDVRQQYAKLPPDKVDQTIEDIDMDLERDALPPSWAGNSRGRLGWARNFLFGRDGTAALVPLRDRHDDKRGRVKITPCISADLHWFRTALTHLSGREMPFSLQEWRLVVTISDAEGSGSVANGVWLPREEWFTPEITRTDVPRVWQQRWTREGARTTMITEVEAVRPLLALPTWPQLLTNVLWVHFNDNEGAKFALIRGLSRASDTNDIVHATWTECAPGECIPGGIASARSIIP